MQGLVRVKERRREQLPSWVTCRDPWQRRPAVLTSPALGRRRLQTAQHPAGDLLKTDTAASRPWIRPVNSCPSSQQVSELSHNHFLLACHNERAISQQVEHVLTMNGLPVANKLAHNETYKIQGLQLIAREQCLSSVRKSKRRCCGTPGEMVFTVMYRTFHAFYASRRLNWNNLAETLEKQFTQKRKLYSMEHKIMYFLL